MRNNTHLKTVALLMILVVVFGLMPAIAETPVRPGSEIQTDCFRQFEKCIENIRASFPGGTIDFLDCELAFVRCLALIFKG